MNASVGTDFCSSCIVHCHGATQEARDRQMQQLQDAHAGLHTKLLEAKQQLARRDAAVLQLRQHLAQAHMQLMDHGIDWQGSGSIQQLLEPAPSAKQGLDSAASTQLQGMAAEQSQSSTQQQQQQRCERRSTTDQLIAASVTAGPLSFTAAMDAREREREVKRLDAECKAADEKVWGGASRASSCVLMCEIGFTCCGVYSCDQCQR